MDQIKQEKKGFINKFLDIIETVGNALPHPATLFLIFCVMIMIISGICEKMGVSVNYVGYDTKTKAVGDLNVTAVSLLNAEGIRYIFSSMVRNFTGFAPLGTVLVGMIGIGVCEGSGLMGAAIRKLVTSTPKRLITMIVVFAGVMSNVASDAGYVVLIPLGAVIFLSFGRHPIAGLAAAFAGVSGGFSANLLIGTTDALLAGITTAAVSLIDPTKEVLATSNWYFLAASTFLITILGSIITEKIVEPRLGKYEGDEEHSMDELTATEKKGVMAALVTVLVYIGIMLVLTMPANAPLRVNGTLASWMSNGLIPAMMLFFFLPGLSYGIVTGTIKNDKDVAKLVGKALSGMGGYLVLAFSASQFIAYFGYTKLGTIIAVKGANTLEAIGFTGLPLIIGFVLFSAFINLFMGSASAKWAIMAPVFVPMLMKLGYTPEFTQVAYRIGDSSTNIISPLMSYFAMIIAFAQKYDKKAGLGTIISTMFPFSMCFLIGWTLLLGVWFVLNLPIGPGVSIFM